MVSPPSKLKMLSGSVCVLLTSVSLKLIKIKLIYATLSSWEKKQNGGWKVSDAGRLYFSFYDPSWSESNFILFLFFYSIRVDPDWQSQVDLVWLLYLPDSEAYMLQVDSKNVTDIWSIDINTKTDKEKES